jgi:hypothetical protein
MESIPSTLFGLPVSIERHEAVVLIENLMCIWERQAGGPIGKLDADLKGTGLANIFSPIKAGKSLRMLLDALPTLQLERISPLLQPPLIIGGADDMLATAEGRIILEILQGLVHRPTADPIHITREIVYTAEHLAYEQYRRWGLQHIESVLNLRAGKATTVMGPPAIAFLLLLLVNRSFSIETALRRLPESRKADQARLDEVTGRIIEAYTTVLNPGSRNLRHFSIYGGYARSEAYRRVSWALGTEEGSNYVRPNKIDDLIVFLINELGRSRTTITNTSALAAFDALVAAYRRELPILGALEMAHENRVATSELRTKIEVGLGHHTGRP